MSFIYKLREATETKFYILVSIISSILMLSGILSNRIVDMFGSKVVLGSIAIVFMAGFIDVINNDYGAKKAKTAILVAMITRAIIYGITAILFLLPTIKETVGFSDVAMQTFRIFIGGEIAVLISQYFIDANIFAFIKNKYKSFTISYILSNFSQFVSTFIIFMVGMWGTAMITNINIFYLTISSFAYKYLLQIMLTPVFKLISSKNK